MSHPKHPRLSIFTRAMITACLPLLLLSILFTSTASAWFYFPNPETVTIVTSPSTPMELTVWRLDNSGTPTKYLSTTTDNVTNIPIALDMNFFRWGSRYLAEGDDAVYFAFELVYDSDVFFTAGSRLPLDGEFSADLTYSATDEAGNAYVKSGSYVRFPFYTVGYAIGTDAGINFEGHTALHEAQSASYTDLIGDADLAGVDVLSTQPTGTISGSVEDTTLSTLAPARYKQVVTTESGQTNRLRLIIYVRIQADVDLMNDNLSGNVNMTDSYLTLHTELNLSAWFKTKATYPN